MDRTAFETELRAKGYGEVVDRRMDANALNLEHAHEFDARLLVLEGAMTIASEGKERIYRAGDTFEMSAGCRHSGHVVAHAPALVGEVVALGRQCSGDAGT